MPLAIFDLDNTLLAGDSDYLWGEFLADQGAVDGERYRRENRRFLADYEAGRLDIQAFLRFSLGAWAEHPRQRLEAWRAQFLREKILPIIPGASRALIERHRAAGDILLIITATNRFVTEPIAAELGVPHLLATEVERVDGRFTGRPSGVPCFREGKVTRLQSWLREHGENLDGSHFYSDSSNDLPLLEQVDHPVVVRPDAALRQTALARGWPVLELADATA